MKTSDLVLIPVAGVGILALSRDVFTEALAAGTEMMAATAPSVTGATSVLAEPLLDADQAAARLSVTARWLEDNARSGIIPHHKLGRFLRFRVSEVAAHSRIEGAPWRAKRP